MPGRRVLQVVGLLLGLLAWELYGRVWGSNFTVPPVSSVFAELPDLLSTRRFWSELGTTLISLVAGILVVLPMGAAVGALVGLSRRADRLLSPYLVVGLAAPMVALIPVLVILFGLGFAARLSVVVVFAMPMLAINVASGYQHTRGDLVEMSRSFGVSRRREFWKVRTMAALPAIFAGLRLAVSRAFVGVIVAELLVLTTGLGRLLLASSGQFKGAEMYGIVLVIFAIGILTLGAVGMAERRALRWNDQSSGGSGA